MGSGRRLVAAGLAAAALGCGLSGCVSTQHKNARAKLVAARTVDGRRPLRIAARSRDVRVLGVQLVRGGRRGAVVVTLRNAGARAVTDVPIAVGVRAPGGRRRPLNGGRGLAWFQTHVPAIGAGARVAWVFVPRRTPPAGRPWALAGRGRAVAALPSIAARTDAKPTRRAVRVTLANASDIPQYGVQVYALARSHGRVVAAGVGSVRHLGSHGRAGVRVALVGRPGRHTIRIQAPATIFE